VVLIAVAPVLAMAPGWLGPQLVTLAVAVMLLLVPGAPETDIHSSVTIFKPLAVAALLPAVWMVLQIIPLPLGSIEHPVWRSAAAALREGSTGHVSVDLGFTVRALFGYMSLVSLAFLTSILTRNRERAETILFALCTITTFVAVELLVFRGLTTSKSGNASSDFTSSLVALAAFGIILNVAFIVRAAERLETRSKREPQSLRALVGMMLSGTAGAVVCLVALIFSATFDILIMVVFGMTVISLVILIRRLRLDRWTAATLGIAAFVACGGIIVLQFAANSSAAPLLRFTRVESPEAGAAVQRMMFDANWTGSGAGSYQALAAIYRDATGAPGEAAINTITSMVLEWGYGGLLITAVLLLQLLIALFRGALSRGRDSFYPAAAAACLVIAFGEAYCDAGFTEVTVQMLTAIIVGLGLSQTTGRQVG
jgi:hypothetical protein